VTSRIAAAEMREAEESERQRETAQAAREAATNEALAEENQVQPDSDEDADLPDESEEMRALKARRRELKAMLKAQRPTETKKPAGGKQAKKEKTIQKAIKPGYTVPTPFNPSNRRFWCLTRIFLFRTSTYSNRLLKRENGKSSSHS
jgi:hypothetical protein